MKLFSLSYARGNVTPLRKIIIFILFYSWCETPGCELRYGLVVRFIKG